MTRIRPIWSGVFRERRTDRATASGGVNRAIVLQGLVLALSLAGAQTAASGTPLINACALLTDSEVAAVLGQKVYPGERHDSGAFESGNDVGAPAYSSTCLWRVASEGPPPSDPNKSLGGASYAILNAMQFPASSGQAKSFVQSFRDAAKDGTIDRSPVALKIADDALWWGDGVAVCKGDRSFGISVHLVGGRPKERSMEEALAKKIAARL
jgi:hypothetical protein